MAERGEGGRWLPGKSANPSGRPKDTFRLAERAREYNEECLEFLVMVMRGLFKDEGAQFRDRVTATQEILNRGNGKPAQALKVTGATDGDAGKLIVEFVKEDPRATDQDS